MKKKIIIAVVAVVAIVACILIFTSKKPQSSTVNGEPVTVNIEPDTTDKNALPSDYNKKTTVILPISVVDSKYNNDLEKFAEDNGYFSVQKKGDSHVKIEMREYSYKLLLTSVGMETVKGIGYAMDSGDYPYFTDLIKYNSDFSEIIIGVNKEEYEKAENKDLLFNTIGVYGLYYQDYCQDSERKCRILVCEEGTNVLIEEREITEKSITQE